MAHTQNNADRDAGRGIRWPRLYDLLVLLLTRGRDRVYREALLDLAAIAPGNDLLDIGCGTGATTLSAWARVQPGSATGTDISEPMLDSARRKARRAGRDIDFVHADAARLPFADARFDVVLMTTVMHMVAPERRGKSLEEMARVLKPGGRALIVDYGGPVESRRGFAARHGRHGGFDLYELKDGMEKAGFSRIEAGPVGWLDLHFLRAETA